MIDPGVQAFLIRATKAAAADHLDAKVRHAYATTTALQGAYVYFRERLKEKPAVGGGGELGVRTMKKHAVLPPMAACHKAHFVGGRD